MDSLFEMIKSFGTIIIVVIVVLVIVGAIFIVKAVSAYKKSEKDKKYDDMLKEPLQKFGDERIEDLAKKYETDEGE